MCMCTIRITTRPLITVYLTVNGGTTSGITWSPNPVTITAAAGGSTAASAVNLSSATAGTFTASITGSGLSVSGVSTTSTTPAAGYVIVYGNPYGLSSNTYSGSLVRDPDTNQWEHGVPDHPGHFHGGLRRYHHDVWNRDSDVADVRLPDRHDGDWDDPAVAEHRGFGNGDSSRSRLQPTPPARLAPPGLRLRPAADMRQGRSR